VFAAKNARMRQNTIKSASHPVTNDVVYSLITSRISPQSRVLDFGAGLGHMSQRLGAFFEQAGQKPEERLTACEVVPEIFQYTGVRCQKIGVDSVIPFPDAAFDLIYAIEVLEHTFRPYDFFHQAFAKLKKGGWLIVTVPNSLHFQSRLSFLGVCGDVRAVLHGGEKRGADLRPYHAAELCELCLRAAQGGLCGD
jgi:2-polyprenyl-3-methyl-5-hydroxy-6-metoxy-1,4-benzoquinol methylase